MSREPSTWVEVLRSPPASAERARIIDTPGGVTTIAQLLGDSTESARATPDSSAAYLGANNIPVAPISEIRAR